MRRSAALTAVVLASLACSFTGTAEARYLPYTDAILAIHADSQAAAREVDWDFGPEYGKCRRYSLGRYECQVSLEGHTPVEYDPDRGTIYLNHFCSWVAVAHWRGRYVVVNRRELTCEEWEESSR